MPSSARPPSPISTADTRPAKRKRRALSCNECIRRKTRCSALGTVPCEACVKRGRPGDCVWEGVSEKDIRPAAGVPATDPIALSSSGAAELAALRAEVQELKAAFHSHLAQCRPPPPPSLLALAPPPAPTSLTLPPLGSVPSASTPASSSSGGGGGPPYSSWLLPTVSEMDRKVETAVAGLEELVTAGGSAPRPESRMVFHNQAATTPSTSSPSSMATPIVTPPTLLNTVLKPSPASHLPAILDSAKRDDALWDSIGSVVPVPQTSQVLVDAFLASPYHKSWHAFIGPTFLREHYAFCADSSPLRLRGVDPTWVALYLMVLAFGIKSLSLSDVTRIWPRYDLQEAARLPRALYEASMLALKIGRCDAQPQVRHIQTVMLYVPFLFHFGPASDGTAAMSHISSALTILQWLGLDRLANDYSRVPKGDPALRDLHPAAAFELCKVLVHSFCLLDGTISKRYGLCRLAESLSSANATALPLFWNDGDLDAGRLTNEPASRWVDSSSAVIGSLFGTANRQFMRDVESYGQDPTIESVLRYDHALRGIMAQIPRLENEPPGVVNFMQVTILASICNRILRAHRPFMVRGYTDDRYSYSRSAALDSARTIIASQRYMMACPQYRPTFVNRWILGAAFVVAIDSAVDHQGSSDSPRPLSTADKRREITSALEMFRQPNPADPTPDVTDQCARTVQALLETLSRWHEAKARGETPGGPSGADLGGFLQQVKDSLEHFTDDTHESQNISSSQLASIQNPAPGSPDFDWNLLLNVGAFPDGMNLEQEVWSFQLD